MLFTLYSKDAFVKSRHSWDSCKLRTRGYGCELIFYTTNIIVIKKFWQVGNLGQCWNASLTMEGGVWGIVIIVSAFMIQFLAFGATSSIGVFNIELLDYFDQATVGVSLIGALNFGIFLGTGPIVSFLMTKFSYRKIAGVGSLLIVLGLVGMPLLPYIPSMCLCYGVLTGFGSSCVYLPSHVLSGLYYEKYRSVATGVATSGSGLGGAVMPVVTGLLIEQYTWKGSFIILAGLCLHLFIFSLLLLMPPDLNSAKTREINIPETTTEALSASDQGDVCGNEEGKLCLTVSEDNQKKMSELTELSNGELGFKEVDVSQVDGANRLSGDVCSRSLDNVSSKPYQNGCDSASSWKDGSSPSAKLLNGGKGAKNLSGLKPLALSVSSLHAVGSRGSGYLVVDSSPDVHQLSTTAVRDAEEVKVRAPNASRHVYIFTSYPFDVYFVSNILWNAGCAIVGTFGPEFLREKGLTSMQAAWLSGSFGLGTFLGGIFGGLIGNVKCVNRQVLYTGANIVMGVFVIAFPNFEGIPLYATCLIISGFAFGIILGLLVIVLTDLIGIDSLGNGLGYLMLSNGLGTFIGPPLAGLVRSPEYGFKMGIILAGVLCIAGGFTMFLMPCRRCCLSDVEKVEHEEEKEKIAL
ncbi:monocarboxylate transporter 9 isoform X1 [Aplysia californica]|uniref:Monocarboxylate transporter 9 isoform X1 n=1 Tax=Aplysia californica TaxID=6500 RepID=A0ABM0JNN8_APLCA|nr:monocarboxylate transporter 9 isoform X1 [Aplysia californica]